MKNYSENEREFFKSLLLDYEIRIDGRNKLAVRNFEVFQNVLPSCFSSSKLTYDDNQKEILFAIKGDIVQLNPNDESSAEKLFQVSIDTMYKVDDPKLKMQLENYIETLTFGKIPKDAFKVDKNNNEYFWKFYLDIYVFDTLKLSLLQILALGVKNVIKSIKTPRMIIFKNEITGAKEYDLIENYEDVTLEEKEIALFEGVELPEIYVFAELNNTVYLDPTEEETSVATSIVIVSSFKDKTVSIQSIGASVDIQKILDLNNLLKSIEIN
jgi:exosome complex RNA-binding protein Rrp42 (RNase PH superfamily)